MSQLRTLPLTAAAILALSANAWSQQAQTGQVPANGRGSTAIGTVNQGALRSGIPSVPAGPGVPAIPATPGQPAVPFSRSTSAAAQTEMPGQSGTISDFGPAAQRQGQFTPDGRFVQGGQFFNNFNNFNVGVAIFIPRTPWFTGFAAGQQLGMNQLQFQELSRAYQDARLRYNQAVSSLPSNLVLPDRRQRLQELQGTFYRDFSDSVNTVLPDPQQRLRFNRVSQRFQFGGAGSQSLQPSSSLEPEQQRRIRLMANQWNQQLQQLRERAAESTVADQEINRLELEAREQIEAVLTPEQLLVWQPLVDPYYNYPLSIDFSVPAQLPPNTVPPANGGTDVEQTGDQAGEQETGEQQGGEQQTGEQQDGTQSGEETTQPPLNAPQ